MKRLEDMTEPELSDIMRAVAKSVEMTFFLGCIEKPLFAIVVFNDPKSGQYISNCSREDMVKAMRETADRLELKQDVARG